MTNQAISTLLSYLSSVVRDASFVSPGMIDVPRKPEVARFGRQDGVPEVGSLEPMLRVIDDIQELISCHPIEGSATQYFDAGRTIGEAVDLLNLVAAGHRKKILLRVPDEPCAILQSRYAMDYALMRLLTAALELTKYEQLDLVVEHSNGAGGINVSICSPGRTEGHSLLDWLKQDINSAAFPSHQDLPSKVALMVAGRRFRLLEARFSGRQTTDGSQLIIEVPSEDVATETAHIPDQGLEGLNILVAEDFDESFLLTSLALEDENVWRAHNGYEAIEMVQRNRFDAVLMDVHMPGMDGFDAIRGIRQWETGCGNPRTPIIILSSDDLETQKRSAAQAGCSGYLRKPLCRTDLLAMLVRIKLGRDNATKPNIPFV